MDLQPSNQTQKPQGFPFSVFTRRDLRYALSFFGVLVCSIAILNLFSPFDSQFISRLGSLYSQIVPNNHKSSSSSSGTCDYSYGRWLRDKNFPLQLYTESCPFLDPGFRCSQSGRKDEGYRQWRWQPAGCDLLRWVWVFRSLFLHDTDCIINIPCMLVLYYFIQILFRFKTQEPGNCRLIRREKVTHAFTYHLPNHHFDRGRTPPKYASHIHKTPMKLW